MGTLPGANPAPVWSPSPQVRTESSQGALSPQPPPWPGRTLGNRKPSLAPQIFPDWEILQCNPRLSAQLPSSWTGGGTGQGHLRAMHKPGKLKRASWGRQAVLGEIIRGFNLVWAAPTPLQVPQPVGHLVTPSHAQGGHSPSNSVPRGPLKWGLLCHWALGDSAAGAALSPAWSHTSWPSMAAVIRMLSFSRACLWQHWHGNDSGLVTAASPTVLAPGGTPACQPFPT